MIQSVPVEPVAANPPGGQSIGSVVVVVQCQAKLLDVVLALRAPRGFTGLLHGWQQQGDQHRNNCNDDQQLDQGKRTTCLLHRQLPL